MSHRGLREKSMGTCRIHSDASHRAERQGGNLLILAVIFLAIASSAVMVTLNMVTDQVRDVRIGSQELVAKGLAQAGAVFRGLKLIETAPGLAQKPTLRWLPEHLFERDQANQTILLYYTGLTRLAKNILQEIVRGIFLNSPAHLRIIDQIGANADRAAAAVQTCSRPDLEACIRASWRLNQELDAGTNPPEVQAILNAVAPELAAAKLLGAGGGGYLLLFAKDHDAAGRIRRTLAERPPNPRARFVDFSLSQTGLQLTRS